jgi:hypothetical protein
LTVVLELKISNVSNLADRGTVEEEVKEYRRVVEGLSNFFDELRFGLIDNLGNIKGEFSQQYGCSQNYYF